MNVQQFLRQASYIRSYTPGVTSDAMTISALNIIKAQYFILGQLVVVNLSITFTTAVGPSPNVFLTTPTEIETDTFASFGGLVEQGVMGLAAPQLAQEVTINKYDSSNWTIGALQVIGGILIYTNAERNH